jgi:hypothetical protein
MHLHTTQSLALTVVS